jgi:non-ribosomal peptide synthetase component E (peptide arylation enzyme)
MTNAQRKQGQERIVVLMHRNAEMERFIKQEEPPTYIEDVLNKTIEENQTLIEQLTKATTARYQFLFNFIGGGWNSEYAHTIEEAQQLASEKYQSEIDLKSFRVSTPADYNNLLSLFY